MESKVKACIINVALGGWYPQGQKRLIRSLIHHGFNWDILTWTTWPNNNYDKNCPYNVKPAAFEEAIKRGYTHILWLDSSFWAINNPNSIFDIINDQGYYFVNNGYNCGQECNDNCLNYFGVSRDIAEGWKIAGTGIMGINLNNKLANKFIFEWIESGKNGAFSGSREHDNQSKDPRFLWHRQDQSAASIIINKLGMNIDELGKLVSYYNSNLPESILFTIRGM
jgi:hypothetical protein